MEKDMRSITYDQSIEGLMTQLFRYRLEGRVPSTCERWEAVFENLKLCHEWLRQLEVGSGDVHWWEQIEEGVRIAQEDLRAWEA